MMPPARMDDMLFVHGGGVDCGRIACTLLFATASFVFGIRSAEAAIVLPTQVAELDCMRTRDDRAICFDKVTGKLVTICMLDKIGVQWNCSPVD